MWQDPIPEGGQRVTAAALKGMGQKGEEVPEWQKVGLPLLFNNQFIKFRFVRLANLFQPICKTK